MNQEQELFEKTISTTNSFLKIIGLHLIDKNDVKKRFLRSVYMCFVFISFNVDILAEVAWVIDGINNGLGMVELFYAAPGMTYSLLSNVKAFFFMKNECHVRDLLNSLRTLQAIDGQTEKTNNVKFDIMKRITFLTTAINIQKWINIFALCTFAIIPFAIMALSYSQSGKTELVMPFPLLYPFNIFDVRIWPIMYLREMFSAVCIVFAVFGPDCFYYTCCTFIQAQFISLHYDLSKIRPETSNETDARRDDTFRSELSLLVNRHNELIRCVSLMESIYSKSTLFNVVTSSFLICLTGFNITVNTNDVTFMMPFVGFLFLVSLQTFLLCYFGDLVMRSSIELSEAAYNCKWYDAEASAMKDVLFVLTRAQKPCKLTAYGFSDINILTFTRILSTAWSYFALLNTVHHV